MRYANAERDGAAPGATFRLNVFGMADARRRLHAAGVLDWGRCTPLEELRYVAGNEEQEFEAFQHRLRAWCSDVEDEDFTRVAKPGTVIAAKLFFNDGFCIGPAECGVIADALESAPESHLRDFASWCRSAIANEGVLVW